MSETILILGGTKEAVEIAIALKNAHPDARIIYSMAGRTKEPIAPPLKTRIGGFGGVDGLVKFLVDEQVTRIIDATHPFAKQISQNARTAASITGITLDIRTREPWQKQADDQWIEVQNIDAAIAAIPAEARVLLALGSQHIEPFSTRHDVHFLVRMVDKPDAKLPLPDHTVLTGRPSTSWHAEAALLRDNAITHIVCRNSGGTGAYAKIKAARALSLPVIIIRQSA